MMAELVKGESGDWEMVVGLEVHAQVISKAKLFSGAATEFGAEPNSQVSLVDAAMPGMLPVINGKCVEQAVRTGLGLKAEINLFSVFDRKNYFYPDLPPGYQISQYLQPVVGRGEIVLDLPDGAQRTVGITRLHMEQDAGKSLHDQDPRRTFVDLNRAGVALMEIVSEPDMRSAEEAGIYFAKLRSILRYLGTCDGNMEEGSMRADVNVSVRRPGEPLGTRCEIKNVNSIRFVKQAVDYEARRQVEVLEAGGTIEQETRLFDSERGETRPMRTKEEAHDYRYFPDPDLLPLKLDPEWVNRIRLSLPELPDEKKYRFMMSYFLPAYTAARLCEDYKSADYFDDYMIQLSKKLKIPDPRFFVEAANLMITELFGLLNQHNVNIENSPISAKRLAEAFMLKVDGSLSGKMLKQVIREMWATGKNAAAIVAEQGLEQVTDQRIIEAEVIKVIEANPKQVEQFRAGNDKVIGWFIGQVMKSTKGQAGPKIVHEILWKKLKG